MEAKIKLTKTMLDKSIIDANKSVREFLDNDFGMSYDDPFFTQEWYDIEAERTMRNAFFVVGEYIDGTEANIKFYRSAKRGDKRISIQKLKQYADAGDIVRLSSDAESLHDGLRIFIQVHRPLEDDDAA
tara:strand:- start:373 stop:759 length:387 start_codon:yes stop_codon:yes gene_type:complete